MEVRCSCGKRYGEEYVRCPRCRGPRQDDVVVRDGDAQRRQRELAANPGLRARLERMLQENVAVG